MIFLIINTIKSITDLFKDWKMFMHECLFDVSFCTKLGAFDKLPGVTEMLIDLIFDDDIGDGLRNICCFKIPRASSMM